MKVYTSYLSKYSEFKEKLVGHFNTERSQNIVNTKIMLGVTMN